MAEDQSDIERADRASRRRSGLFIAFAVIFLTQQAAFLANAPTGRAVDTVRIASWLILAALMLGALLTGGVWLRAKAIRDLMDDEVTKANRSSAVMLAFAVSMIAAIALFVLAPMASLTAQQAIHAIVSLGLATGLIRFAMLERRALG